MGHTRWSVILVRLSSRVVRVNFDVTITDAIATVFLNMCMDWLEFHHSYDDMIAQICHSFVVLRMYHITFRTFRTQSCRLS